MKPSKLAVVMGLALGCPVGVLFPLILWGVKLWLKTEGYSYTVVGSVGFVSLISVLKMPFSACVWRLMAGRELWRSQLFLGSAGLLIASVVVWAIASWGGGDFRICVSLIFCGTLTSMVVDAAFESVRIYAGRALAHVGGRLAVWFSLGLRVGALIVKFGLLFCVGCVGWTLTFKIYALFLLMLSVACYICFKGVVIKQHRCLEQTGSMWGAVKNLFERGGVGLFFLPFSLVLADTSMRSMLGLRLIELGFDYHKIALYYGLSQGSAFAFIWGGRSILSRRFSEKSLFLFGFLNTLMLLAFAWADARHMLFVGVMMAASGGVQGIFLHMLRIYLARFTSPPFVFLQMGLFFTLWALSSALAACSGVLVDTFGWMKFCYFMALIYPVCALPLYFLVKKV